MAINPTAGNVQSLAAGFPGFGGFRSVTASTHLRYFSVDASLGICINYYSIHGNYFWLSTNKWLFIRKLYPCYPLSIPSQNSCSYNIRILS